MSAHPQFALIPAGWSVYVNEHPKANSVVTKAQEPRSLSVWKTPNLLQEPMREVCGQTADSNEEVSGRDLTTLYVIGHCPRSESRTKLPPIEKPLSPHEISPSAVSLDRELRPVPKQSMSERIMARLAQLEAREVNPHLKDDYRLAWITVFNASDNSRVWTDSYGPWEFSFSSMFGRHPRKAIASWVERAAKDAAMEGSVRKPVQSYKLLPRKEGAA